MYNVLHLDYTMLYLSHTQNPQEKRQFLKFHTTEEYRVSFTLYLTVEVNCPYLSSIVLSVGKGKREMKKKES